MRFCSLLVLGTWAGGEATTQGMDRRWPRLGLCSSSLFGTARPQRLSQALPPKASLRGGARLLTAGKTLTEEQTDMRVFCLQNVPKPPSPHCLARGRGGSSPRARHGRLGSSPTGHGPARVTNRGDGPAACPSLWPSQGRLAPAAAAASLPRRGGGTRRAALLCRPPPILGAAAPLPGRAASRRRAGPGRAEPPASSRLAGRACPLLAGERCEVCGGGAGTAFRAAGTGAPRAGWGYKLPCVRAAFHTPALTSPSVYRPPCSQGPASGSGHGGGSVSLGGDGVGTGQTRPEDEQEG